MGRPRIADLDPDTQTKDRVLRAAEDLFAAEGYSGASIKAIAERAGVTGAMIHYYFDSKERLYHAVLDHIVGELQEMATEIVATGKPPVERLEIYLRWFFDYAARHPNIARLTVMGLGTIESDYFAQMLDKAVRPLFKMGEGFLQKGIDEGIFRPVSPHHFLASVYGMMIPFFSDVEFFGRVFERDPVSEEELEARLECILDIVFRALDVERNA